MILRKIFTILFFLSFITAQAQDKEQIEADFNQYLNSLLEKDFEKTVDYLLPEFFEIIPKNKVIKLMEMAFNSSEVDIIIKNQKILEIGPPAKIENKKYSSVRYSNNMIMVMNSESEEDEFKELTHKLMKMQLENTFGASNVTFKEKLNSWNIYSEKDVVAIQKNGEKDWKFVVVETKQMFILEQLLPEEVIAQYKK